MRPERGAAVRGAAVWLAAAALGAGAAAQTPGPDDLRAAIGFDQRLGERVPLDARFRDETGREVRLGELLGAEPAVLALVYYECPMLCNLVLNGLVAALRAVALNPGEDFRVIAVSIDPEETPALARAKRERYLREYDRPATEDGWRFLVGEELEIRALADAVGFRYAYDAEAGEYAHAAGVVVLTPAGRLSRYFYGIEYAPRDLRLGLVEASDERIGSAVDQLLLYCFHYDPTTGRYGLVIMNVLRLAGAATVAVLAVAVGGMLLRERRARRRQGTEPRESHGGAGVG